MIVGTGWFRQAPDRFYVPIAVAVPGSAVPAPQGSATRSSLDVRGIVRDEQGRTVGRLRETHRRSRRRQRTRWPDDWCCTSQASTLPPGRFSVKVVVRENPTGTIGSFEAPIYVPQLRDPA